MEPTVIKGFPGEAVDRHLKAYGHLPELGCCEHDQPEPEKVAPPEPKPHHKGFSSNQKTRIARMCRAKIEAKGGRFLSINWKKKTVHFVDGKGNRCVSHPNGAF